MQLSGKGRHRRPSKTSRIAAVTGLAGATIALPLVSATGAQAAPADSANNWDKVAQCESGGNWNTKTGNGFSGGLQFTQQTWAGHGGTQYAPSADQASKDQQIQVAEKVLASQGKGAWPNCGTGLGKASPSSGTSQQSAPQQPQQNQPSQQPQQAQPQHSAPAQQPQQSNGGNYTVRSGDTLGSIAAAHGTSWHTVYQNNRSAIGGNPNLILPGQQLHV